MLGKLRPVGSRIPIAGTTSTTGDFPWGCNYSTDFTGSGTEALAMAIALAMARRRAVSAPEIIIPAYGCPDLIAAILAQGGKPVLVDLLPNSPFMDESQMRRAVTGETVAVVAVGLLGFPERLDVLSVFCRERALFLIEDSAQCFPPASCEYPWADCVVLSFGRGKPINLMGGGALLVRNEFYDDAATVIRQFPLLKENYGIAWRFKRLVFHILMARGPYFCLEKLPFLRIGETTFKECLNINRLELSEGLVLAGIKEFFARPLIHPLYDRELQAFEQTGWIRLGCPGSIVSETASTPRIRYGLLAPTKELRDRAEIVLNNAGIGASGFYREILPEIEGLQEICGSGHFPDATNFASRLLTLPCHEDVKPADVDQIARILQDLNDN